MRTTKKESGFTLVEILLGMALLSIFVVVLLDIIVSVLNAQSISQAYSSVSQDGRYLLSRLDYDIQRADSVTTPANLGQSSPTLVLVIGGATHTYSVNNGLLELTTGGNTDALNSTETTVNAGDLEFVRIGNASGTETIRTTFTVESANTTHAGGESRTFTTTFGRRL